jgi:phosphonate metabolism protein (transferase hexapeptide repeat family)
VQEEPRLRHSNEPRIHKSADLKNSRIGKQCEIGERVILREVTVGDFTYFERQSEAIYSEIGKFCSIASHVRINALEHPMNRITMHKITYRPNEFFFNHGIDQAFKEHRSSKKVTIGHDVWIGHGAVILPNVTIGTGAVIGANAVVKHDVLPFQIAAGVPTKFIRMRFTERIQTRILDSAWWDWPIDKIASSINDMQNMDIESFLEKWDKS